MSECDLCGGIIGPWPEAAVNDPRADACECAQGEEKMNTAQWEQQLNTSGGHRLSDEQTLAALLALVEGFAQRLALSAAAEPVRIHAQDLEMRVRHLRMRHWSSER